MAGDGHFFPPAYCYAATSNRDMAGGEYHRQQPCYVILVDDL